MTAKSGTGGEPASSSNYAAAPSHTDQTDPTALTTDSIRREIGATRESFGLEIANLKTLIAGLKEGTDVKFLAAAELSNSRLDAYKTICDEKFVSVGDKLDLGERQRVEQKSDTATAIQAALLAQQAAVSAQAESFEKSVNKSEIATSRQLDQLGSTFRTEIGAIASNQGDQKDRLTRIETGQISQTAFDQVVASLRAEISDLKKYRDANEGRTGGLSTGWSWLVGAVGLLAAIVAIVVALSR